METGGDGGCKAGGFLGWHRPPDLAVEVFRRGGGCTAALTGGVRYPSDLGFGRSLIGGLFALHQFMSVLAA